MKVTKLLLASLPAAVILPAALAPVSYAQYFSGEQPELEAKPAIHLHEGTVRLPFYRPDTTAIPDMSSASAVRVGCGIGVPSDLRMYRGSGGGESLRVKPQNPVAAQRAYVQTRVKGAVVRTKRATVKQKTSPGIVQPLPIRTTTPNPVLIP